jgi:hypothetical protein
MTDHPAPITVHVIHHPIIPDLCVSAGAKYAPGPAAAKYTNSSFLFVKPLSLWSKSGTIFPFSTYRTCTFILTGKKATGKKEKAF